MPSNLFAFNVSQEIPHSEVSTLNGEVDYDPQRQVWRGSAAIQAGVCCGSYETTATTTHYCTIGYPSCGALDNDSGTKSDYADCE